MTNKEWLATLPADKLYDVLDWLMHIYGKMFTDTREAIIAWADLDHAKSVITDRIIYCLRDE